VAATERGLKADVDNANAILAMTADMMVRTVAEAGDTCPPSVKHMAAMLGTRCNQRDDAVTKLLAYYKRIQG
jgi:hypothetical protein